MTKPIFRETFADKDSRGNKTTTTYKPGTTMVDQVTDAAAYVTNQFFYDTSAVSMESNRGFALNAGNHLVIEVSPLAGDCPSEIARKRAPTTE